MWYFWQLAAGPDVPSREDAICLPDRSKCQKRRRCIVRLRIRIFQATSRIAEGGLACQALLQPTHEKRSEVGQVELVSW